VAEPSFILYGTSACHLCEQAEALLASLPLTTPVPLDVVDISDDDSLLACYGTRIPVLQRVQAGETQELDWPFSAAQALALLKHSHSFVIRAATPEDYPVMDEVFRASANALCAQAYAADVLTMWAGQRWPERFALGVQNGDELYVLQQGGSVVGFGALNRAKQLLEALFVHPTVAGRGLGQALYDFLLAKAVTYGMQTLHVVSSLNAAQFYAKNGFVETSREDFHSRTGAVLKSVHMTLERLP
jgi:predicted N-acetyltransferase YhbS